MNVEERFNELAKDVVEGDSPGSWWEELVEYGSLLVWTKLFIENYSKIESHKYDDECNSDGNDKSFRNAILEKLKV